MELEEEGVSDLYWAPSPCHRLDVGTGGLLLVDMTRQVADCIFKRVCFMCAQIGTGCGGLVVAGRTRQVC